MDFLLPARKVKHAAFVARKRVRRGYVRARDLAFTAYSAMVPFTFDVDRHRSAWGELPRMYFLHRDPPPGCSTDRPVQRKIFVLWTGENDLTPNRAKGLQSIDDRNPGSVVLVTPKNLDDYIVPGKPLHSAYRHLSLVHRADYLRAYLMHHHGGGYSDIKVCRHSWVGAFERFESDPALWIIGYPEIGSDMCGGRDPRLGHEIRRRYRSLVGFGAFICRPGTPLTAEWLRELDRRLDYYSEELAQHPGDAWGENPGYPILWIELGADVLNPLQLKYLDHVGQDPMLLPQLTDHR